MMGYIVPPMPVFAGKHRVCAYCGTPRQRAKNGGPTQCPSCGAFETRVVVDPRQVSPVANKRTFADDERGNDPI